METKTKFENLSLEDQKLFKNFPHVSFKEKVGGFEKGTKGAVIETFPDLAMVEIVETGTGRTIDIVMAPYSSLQIV